LSLLERFDEVLVMRDGRLLAQGSVDELTLGCPEFQRLTAALRRESGAEEGPPSRSNAA
jgi:ABC-type multidrug transport system fused ATPase/permease subunit